jgi:ABC-type multidrug transport system ATPase subunit
MGDNDDNKDATNPQRSSLQMHPHKDRKDHFETLRMQTRLSMPRVSLEDSNLIHEVKTNTEASFEIEEDERYGRMREKLLGRTVEVTVCLRDFSFHVPVKTDVPNVKTVLNQSPCYGAYELGRRLVEKCCKSDGLSRLPTTAAEVFLPYQKESVLTNINLVLKPGKTYLILGPPGSGKTSLLKAIAGRLPNYVNPITKKPMKSKPHISGRVEFNGVSVEDDPSMVLANIVSFVGQLDCHAPYLTVSETFEFANMCRTGGRSRKHSTVSENLTIEGLDLAGCKDTFVGNDDVRGVSGGQRRRVTVGEMMQGQNAVACGDEISTGLDAAVTFDIIHSIVAYSRVAMTTRVISLLQPGPETFCLFDEVILLAKGYVIYSGPIAEVVDYFAHLGYRQPATMDVADYLQLIPTPDGVMLLDPGNNHHGNHFTAEEFARAFQESIEYQKILQESNSPNNQSWKQGHNANDEDIESDQLDPQHRTPGVPKEMKVSFQNSFFQSVYLNLERHLTLWKRDKGFIIGKTFENIGMAVATGGILFGTGRITWDQSIVLEEFDEKTSAAFYKLTAGVYGALFMTTFHILLGEKYDKIPCT